MYGIVYYIVYYIQKSIKALEDLEGTGSVPSLYPPSLSPVMLLIDTEGRALIKQLQSSSEIYAKTISELKGLPGHWNKATANRDRDSHKNVKSRERGKNRESSSSDEDDDEEEEGEEEEEEEGEEESGSSGIDSDSSKSDDDDDDDEIRDEGEEKGKKRRRIGGAGRGAQRKNSAISQRSKDLLLIALPHHITTYYTLYCTPCMLCVFYAMPALQLGYYLFIYLFYYLLHQPLSF
jgi:hypothetical protein